MKRLSVLLALPLMASCSGTEEPGTLMESPEVYFGSYEFSDGTRFELNRKQLSFPAAGRTYEVAYRTDKWGDMIVVRPPIWPRETKQEVALEGGPGTGVFIRPASPTTGTRLQFMSNDGKKVYAVMVREAR